MKEMQVEDKEPLEAFKYPVSSKIYVNHATSLGFVLKFGKNQRKQQKSGKLRRKQNLLLAILRLAAINFLCHFVFCVGSFEASLLTAMETCGKDVRISTIPLACVLTSY